MRWPAFFYIAEYYELSMVADPKSSHWLCGVFLLLLSSPLWSAAVTYPRDASPYPEKRIRTVDCVRRHVAADQSFVLLLNHCDRAVYVSVVEFGGLHPDRWCSVFGLQGDGYGKAYHVGEWYEQSSIKVAASSDKALENCGRTGYEVENRNHGEFVHLTD